MKRLLRQLSAINTQTQREYEQEHGALDITQQTSYTGDLTTLAEALFDARPGRRAQFVDAGSGLGVPSMLATHIYQDVYGIEQEHGLVTHAQQAARIAKQNDIIPNQPRYVQGDFLDDKVYEQLGTSFDRVDVFYNFSVRKPCNAFLDKFSRDAKTGARAVIVLPPEDYDARMQRDNSITPHISNLPWYHVIEKKT